MVVGERSYFRNRDTNFLTLSLEQLQLEGAHLQPSKSAMKNLDSVSSLGFSHGNVSEEIGQSMESWRFSNLNTPARLFNDHRSENISAKDSQVQFDYEMAVRLSGKYYFF